MDDWFRAQGWEIFPFQRETWQAIGRGESGLLHCTTGAGKTYAVWGGALGSARRCPQEWAAPLSVLWITPLRALSADTEAALRRPVEDLGLSWKIASRTGDTSNTERRRFATTPPQCLVTTPESLSLLLSQPDQASRLASARLIIVDEWHELLGTKRGVLLELSLAHLRAANPSVMVWALSATLGNVEEAARVLCGFEPDSDQPRSHRIVSAHIPKDIRVECVLPPDASQHPWGGHLGLRLLEPVLQRIEKVQSCIVFTNTRSQAELWHQAIANARPQWPSALHHGSIDRELRTCAEQGLRDGTLRVVVATSSLDLGVDFSPVECVMQIGSPKGVARLLQRAGRSGHSPGRPSTIFCVPANSLELAEIASVRDLINAGRLEARVPLTLTLDVLCQHLLTIGAGSGFDECLMLREVRTSNAFHHLSTTDWNWALDFAARGGESLKAYPQFARLHCVDGRWRMLDRPSIQRHRLSIGTITSEASVAIRIGSGKSLGSVEESFVTRLRPGDKFLFAGHCLKLERLRDLVATVRVVPGRPSGTPRWMGGKMPLSTHLADALRARLDDAAAGKFEGPEMKRLQPILEIQAVISRIPRRNELLIEEHQSREGYHAFIYPFAGRLAHDGLAALFALRLGRLSPNTFTLAANDYGIEILGTNPLDMDRAIEAGLFRLDHLADDILAGLNSSELAKRQFREIARIAGLTFEGYASRRKSMRQVQVSAGLLYDVFSQYDPRNRLLEQARSEVLERQLDERRLVDALQRIDGQQIVRVMLDHPSPIGYPLFIERLREQLSTEELADRMRRMELHFVQTRR